MALCDFDPNGPACRNSNVFGLPFSEQEASVVLLPVPWEVTVSYGAGTSRAPEHIFRASQQIDLYDNDNPRGWEKGFFMLPLDKNVLKRSDYLRKEAELYINFQLDEGKLEDSEFMQNGLHEVNKGGAELNHWVEEQCLRLLKAGKYVGLVGGDHSTPLGYYRALGRQYPEFGILHIDAHLDLRKCYEDFKYSHASIMYNALEEVPQITRLVSVSTRDCCLEEIEYAKSQKDRVAIFFDQDLKRRAYEGTTWRSECDRIVEVLPQLVYVSFDIDGLDPKLCPHTGTPVMGGLETEQVFYLFHRILESGRRLIGFDVVEVGFSHDEYDANIGARVIFKLCNLLVSQQQPAAKQQAAPLERHSG